MSVDPTGVPTPPESGDSSSAHPAGRPMAVGQLTHNRAFVEFVGKLDAVMRASAEPVKRKPVFSRPAKLVIAAVLILMLALGKEVLWSWWSNYVTMPNELVGVWSTSAGRFADRGFVITRDSLQLRLGEGQSVMHPIMGVRRGRGANRDLFTFDYRDGDLDLQIGLHMKADSIVHIENVPGIVWTKESR